MLAIIPNPIPAEAGCCVVRLGGLGGTNEPETPKERELAAALPATLTLWRAFVWHDGRVFLSAFATHERPLLAHILYAQNEFPLEWVELLRASKS